MKGTEATGIFRNVDEMLKTPPVDIWFAPALIQPNHFVCKSLSSWSYNIAVGCSHGCRFCYVPAAATIKQARSLAQYGVIDPGSEWGSYVFVRCWDEKKFLASLRAAERTPSHRLNPDGNRAVMFCTTTDPYQVIHHPDPLQQKDLARRSRHLVRRALELIRDESSLNVRILTRSPMARLDFDLFRSFGHRLLFGMSLPTLRSDLSKIYEPKAPGPMQRVATLRAAKEAGLHVYVAMAPTFPESGMEDLRATIKMIKELDPITLFHEPINLRADNVARIAQAASRAGLPMRPSVFRTRETWRTYALAALHSVWRLSEEEGLQTRLHLWPDKALGSKEALNAAPDPQHYLAWLKARWSRISEWPTPT